jgi:hypothetical protein
MLAYNFEDWTFAVLVTSAPITAAAARVPSPMAPSMKLRQPVAQSEQAKKMF